MKGRIHDAKAGDLASAHALKAKRRPPSACAARRGKEKARRGAGPEGGLGEEGQGSKFRGSGVVGA